MVPKWNSGLHRVPVGRRRTVACAWAPEVSGRTRAENSPYYLKVGLIVAAVLMVLFYQAAVAQTTITPEALAGRTVPPFVQQLGRAVSLSAKYLEHNCDTSGRFAYLVDTDSGQTLPSYNIIRHAGAIYALAMLNHFHPDSKAVSTMVRAANFTRTNYLISDARSNALAIWSRPAPANRVAELGAAGLGLVALTAVEHAQQGTVPLDQLQALGRFVLLLQKADGSFYSRYFADKGLDRDWQSLYYPGEAVLGLVNLYELDRSQRWLVAAGKGLAYLAESRQGPQAVPPDHWALIATAEFLPYSDQSGCPVSRAELVRDAARICDRFLHEQIAAAPDAKLNGGFDPGGRTTPTAIRLEGLLAALEFLPNSDGDLRARVEVAVERGIAFLLNAQIISGPFAGGMPGTVLATGSSRSVRSVSEVRIDYVQHALSAWLRYEELYQHSGAHRVQ
jgi:hypothetical protein